MSPLFLALTQNAALLISLSVLHGLLSRFRNKSLLLYNILTGLLFGMMAIAGMSFPVDYQPGIIYDGRSVIMVLAGLFGGGIASAIAVVLAGAFRFYLGGPGIIAGITTIVATTSVGLIARHIYKNKSEVIPLFNLWLIGLIAHFLMIIAQLLLPWPLGLEIISKIWIPVITIFPITTLLIGILIQTETKRILSLAKIQESEKRYQALSENSPVGIFRTRPDGYTTYVNPKWIEITGVSFQDALGNGWLESVHPEDREKLFKGWNHATKQQHKSTAEYRYLHKDGRTTWIFGEAVGEFTDEGKLIGYIGTIVDITERKVMEQALKESEANYRNLFENDSAIKLMIDSENGAIINANKVAAKFYGWPVDKLKKLNIEQIRVNDSQGAVTVQKNSITHRKELIEEYQHQLADGTLRNVEVFTNKIRFQGKDCFHSIIHDITAKRKAEERLKLLSKAIEQSPVSITITDPSGKIEYVNPKFCAVTGYQLNEVIGENFSILNSNLHSGEFLKNMWTTISQGKDWVAEVRNKKRNGELYWESQIISPILDNNGKITNFISIKEDITLQKQMLKTVIEAKEKAENAEQLKSAFLANMSHEIRTPLNAILGFASMLTSREHLPETTKNDYIFIINKSAEALLQIINDILDISKLETGQVKIHKKHFQLKPLLKSLHSQYLEKLAYMEHPHIEIKLHSIQPDIWIINDENRLIQIFTNLLDNALKFTDCGKIEFGVSSVTDEDIEFFVSDTGIGIETDDQQSVFERFRQVGDSSTRIHSGNGLGLSIVKSLVELMKGNIELESQVNMGTTFRFKIPL